MFLFLGSKLSQRRSIEKQKVPQPMKMKFDVDPLNLLSIVNRKPGTDSPELASTPIAKIPEFHLHVVNEPHNTSDPLNLFDEEGTVKPGRKRKKKRQRATSMCNDESDSTFNETTISSNVSNYLVSPIENRYSFSKFLKQTNQTVDNEELNPQRIKSPKQNLSFRKSSIKSDRSASVTEISYQNLNIKNKNKKFRHGNFLRNLSIHIDPIQDNDTNRPISSDRRVQNFKEEWFKGKECLDIGCNDGYVTDWISTYFSPKSITGIDFDSGLITIAKNRLRQAIDKSKLDVPRFPLSCQLTYGPISVGSGCNNGDSQKIQFIQVKYILSLCFIILNNFLFLWFPKFFFCIHHYPSLIYKNKFLSQSSPVNNHVVLCVILHLSEFILYYSRKTVCHCQMMIFSMSKQSMTSFFF